MLLLPQPTAVLAGGGLLLMALFTLVTFRTAVRGERPDCHCFGQLHSAPVGWWTVSRNLALTGSAVFFGLAGREGLTLSPVAWVGSLSAAEAIGAVSALVLAGVLSFQGWFCLQLFRQNGRLLNRLDVLETALLPAGELNDQRSVDGDGLGSHRARSTGRSPLDLTVRDLEGHAVSLEHVRQAGKPLLLIFSDPSCGPCNALLPRIAEWQRERRADLVVALISRGDDSHNRTKAREHGLVNVFIQHDREVAQRYRVRGTPAAVLLDTVGRASGDVAEGAESIKRLLDQARDTRGSVLPLVSSDRHRAASRSSGLPVNVGDPAPTITMTDVDGRSIRLADFEGRDLLVLMWSPACRFCTDMLLALRDWEAGPDSAGPALLLVSDGDAAAVREAGLASRLAVDQTFEMGRALGATGTPSAIRVDRRGLIASPLVAGAPAVLGLMEAHQPTIRAC